MYRTKLYTKRRLNSENSKKQKKRRTTAIEGRREAKNLPLMYTKKIVDSIPNNNIMIYSTGRFRKKKMLLIEDITAIYNLYTFILIQRSLVLGDKIKNDKNDYQLNSEYIELMKTQLGNQFIKKANNLEIIMNEVFKFGRTLNYIFQASNEERRNIIKDIASLYILPAGKSESSIYIDFNVIRSFASKRGVKTKANFIQSNNLILFSNKVLIKNDIYGFKSELDLSIFQNIKFVYELIYTGQLPYLLALFRTFRETNDLLTKMTSIIKVKNDNNRRLQFTRLFNIDPKNATSLNFLNLLKSKNNKATPISMLPPPYPGPRHHVMSVSSFRNFINSNVYIGKSFSLQSILWYVDSLLLLKNNFNFNGNNYDSRLPKNRKLRDRGDKPILRQEPALLKPPGKLFDYYVTVNRCNTDMRHGGIHCGLINAGYDKSTGVVNESIIKENRDALKIVANAYSLDKSRFSYKEMYSFLDTSKYFGVYFNDQSVPVKIDDDMDENINPDYFFQSFIYIFGNDTKLQIDIIKMIYEYYNVTSSNTKKFAIQTDKKNMLHLFYLIYRKNVLKVIGVNGLKKVLYTLNSSYKIQLDKNSIDNIINIIKNEEFDVIDAVKQKWKELGFKIPSFK